MTWLEIFFIGTGLSMDAFAVSVGKGLSCRKVLVKNALCAGVWFGGFQAIMPLAGYFLGTSFASLVQSIDHWIAFGLLALIGGNMIREALSQDECKMQDSSFAFKTMFLLAVATSIDALAAGISMAFLNIDIWVAILTIGLTTFCFSVAGVLLGHKLGCRFHKGAEILGGSVLIAIGLKILVEHLFF